VTIDRGRKLQHASTEGMVYRHHQARHLAVVVDSTNTLWALAPNGSDWDAAVAADLLLTALVKGFIRHDLDVQQIYADFPDELRARYGPGLQRLRQPAEPTSEPPRTSVRRGRECETLSPQRPTVRGSHARRCSRRLVGVLGNPGTVARPSVVNRSEQSTQAASSPIADTSGTPTVYVTGHHTTSIVRQADDRGRQTVTFARA
jgi:hypothetical protein